MSLDRKALAIMPAFGMRREVRQTPPPAAGAAAASAAGDNRLVPVAAVLIASILFAVPSTTPAGEQELGAYLAGECTACHRAGAVREGIPSIFGLAESDFVAAMREYRSGTRDATVMRSVAAGLDDRDIAALAHYFGTREVRR